jgi:hypothetical protein
VLVVVAVGVYVGVGVWVGVCVAVLVGVCVAVSVGVCVGTGVAVLVGVLVAVCVGSAVAVCVGTVVAVAVRVGVAVLGIAVGSVPLCVGYAPSTTMQYVGAVMLNNVFVGGLADTEGWMPIMLGRLNVVVPFPPNFVPRIAKSALCWDMFKDCPSHARQPLGTNL